MTLVNMNKMVGRLEDVKFALSNWESVWNDDCVKLETFENSFTMTFTADFEHLFNELKNNVLFDDCEFFNDRHEFRVTKSF